MSEELSRVKSRQKKKTRERSSGGRKTAANVKTEPKKEKSAPVLSRTRKKTSSGKPAPAGRRTTAATARGGSRAARPKAGREEEQTAPSRSATYRSERVRLAKLFVNTRNVLFFVLLAFLLVWGIKGAPPLRTLW